VGVCCFQHGFFPEELLSRGTFSPLSLGLISFWVICGIARRASAPKMAVIEPHARRKLPQKKRMCPNCTVLSTNPDFPHAHLKWRLEEFNPTATSALGAKVFEECLTCGERWVDQRSRHKPPATA